MGQYDWNPEHPRWHGLVLVPCGALAAALGAFMFYDRFWGGALPFVLHPVVSVLCAGAGVVGIGAGLRRLFRL